MATTGSKAAIRSVESWRERSRLVIARVLAALPVGATDAEKRAAVSAAYPFGERRMHPYKCWLAEVKRALPKPRAAPRTVGYKFSLCGSRYYVAVNCDWCNILPSGALGCIACLPRGEYLRDLLAPASEALAFLRTIRAAPEDAAPKLVFADWLADRGDPFATEIEALFREAAHG